jgi:hypothetical protein
MVDQEYVPIVCRGTGLSGEVWYALPERAVSEYLEPNDELDAKTYPDKSSDSGSCQESNADCVRSISDQLARICVVKVWKPQSGGRECQQLERSIRAALRLEAIEAEIPFEYPRLLNFNAVAEDIGEPDRHNWQATSVITGFDLNHLIEATKQMKDRKVIPQALIAHIAVRLHYAICWLHQLDPPGHHNDLHSGKCNARYASSGLFRDAKTCPGRLGGPYLS